MRLSHDPLKISARFDDPNLVSRAGLVPVMSLAERAGLVASCSSALSLLQPLDLRRIVAGRTGLLPAAGLACSSHLRNVADPIPSLDRACGPCPR